MLAEEYTLPGNTGKTGREARTWSAKRPRERPWYGAEYGIRTRDIQLGKLALYQLS